MSSRSHHPASDAASAVGDLLERATDSVRRQVSLERTFEDLLASLERAIVIDRSLVWRHRQDAPMLDVVAGHSQGRPWHPDWHVSATIPGFSDAVATGEFLALSGDTLGAFIAAQGMADAPEPSPAHLLLGPIELDDAQWGLFTLSRIDHEQPFSDQEVGMARSIAALMSIAVRTSLGMETEREHRRIAQRVGAITADFNHARTPEAAARALLQGVELLTGIHHAYVVLFSSSRQEEATVILTAPLQKDGQEVMVGMKPLDHPVELEMFRTGQPVIGERFRKLLLDPSLDITREFDGLAAIPIRQEQHVDGALYLLTPDTPGTAGFRELSDEHLATIESLCEQTAVALERTRLQQLAQQTAREQRILAQIAERVSAASDPSSMAQATVEELATLLPCRFARMTRCSGDFERPTVLGSSPEVTVEIEAVAPLLAVIERWVRDAGERWVGPLGRWLPPGSGNEPLADHHVACVPLAIDTGTVGSLTVLHQDPSAFDDHELDLAEHAATQLALGLQRANSHLDAIQARDEAEHHLGTIERMLRISNEMSRQQTLEDLVNTMEIGLRTLIPHSGHALHRADERRGRLDLIHGSSRDEEHVVPVEVSFGDPVIGKAARLRHASRDEVGLRALLSVPMLIEGELIGTITLWRGADDPFDAKEASLLGIFAAHAGSELRRTEMAVQRRELHIGGIRALVSTVDMRDPFTRGHSTRVGRLSRLIAAEMRMPASDAEMIEVAGLLHDIGKIGIPDAIIQKPGPLDDHERAAMMGHADLGARILQEAQSPALEVLAPLIRHHHEWWDGRGYPSGLRGGEIPIGAQIISVADAWDTMTNDRPYRQRLSEGDAWAALEESAGAQFAPTVIEALGRLRRDDELVLNRRVLEEQMASGERDALPAGRSEPLGDLRSLGILVDLARATSRLSDPGAALRDATALLAERLDVSVALVLDSDADEQKEPEAIAWHEDGFKMLRCRAPDLLDRVLANDLPASMRSLQALPEHPALKELFTNPHNTGVVGVVQDGLPRGAIFFQPSQEDHYWRLELPVIESVAPHVLAVVNVARLHQRAREDALTDGLTGAANYRSFHRELAEWLAGDDPFSLLMFDVVGLKVLNDTVGHLAGDELLRRLAALLKEQLPNAACIARIGGDEFGALVTAEDPREAGNRILAAITTQVAPMYAHTVGVRFGWSSRPDDGDTTADLIHTADQRMYHFGRSPRRQ